MNKKQLSFFDQPLLVDDHQRLWVPDGLYRATPDHWRTFRYKGEPRVEIIFKIIDESYAGVCLGFFSGVRAIVGMGINGGEFTAAGRQSNLGKALRQLEKLIGKSPAMADFMKAEWEVKVISIEYDSQKNPLSAGDIYSKVQSIRPIEVGW